MRIAIFQANHFLQIHTMNLADFLSQNGYEVDLFLFNCNAIGINHKAINESDYKNIKFHIYDNSYVIRALLKVINRLRKRLNIRMLDLIFFKELLFRPMVYHSRKIISNVKFDFLIGVEKYGLIWAGQITTNLNLKLIYYSLEIWDESWHSIKNKREFLMLRHFEKKYHKTASLTLVQDELRAEVLKKINELDFMRTILIPVSLKEDIIFTKSHLLHEILNLNFDKKIILYFGTIAEDRIHMTLLEEINKSDEDFVLVLHGWITESLRQEILNKFDVRKVIISTRFVPENAISTLISSAYIGLSLYIIDNENEKLTAFSSEKVSRYCQSGVPIISFNNVSYGKLFNEFNCGMMINDYSEIGNAIRTIDENYQTYQINAWKAYSKHFNFNNYSELLLNTFSEFKK